MNFVLIAAMDKNNAIGKDGGIPWHIPKDFAWFKEQTMGQTVLMGRKCYQDIIKYTKGKPLPGRKNLVLTSQNIEASGFEFYKSVDEAIKQHPDETIYIIGGAQLYNEFFNHPKTRKLILTRIDTEIIGADTFFPKTEPSKNGFQKTFEKKDNDDKYSFTFEVYER